MTYDYYSEARHARYITHPLTQACKKAHMCARTLVHAVGRSAHHLFLWLSSLGTPKNLPLGLLGTITVGISYACLRLRKCVRA